MSGRDGPGGTPSQILPLMARNTDGINQGIAISLPHDTNCAMIDTPPHSPEAMGHWIADHAPGVGVVTRIENCARGQTNQTFLIEVAGGRFVLLAKPPSALLHSALMPNGNTP